MMNCSKERRGNTIGYYHNKTSVDCLCALLVHQLPAVEIVPDRGWANKGMAMGKLDINRDIERH